VEYQCELLERSAQPALVIRTRTPVANLPQVIGQAYGAIMAHAGQLGAQPSGAPYVAYHNMDMDDLDLEIGFPFAQELAGNDPVLAGEIPGGKAVTVLHTGPYEAMVAAYEAVQTYMEANGYVPTGVVYESYLNSPETTPPAGLQTQIVFPLV
jgi:effector-binding domain-containing protein